MRDLEPEAKSGLSPSDRPGTPALGERWGLSPGKGMGDSASGASTAAPVRRDPGQTLPRRVPTSQVSPRVPLPLGLGSRCRKRQGSGFSSFPSWDPKFPSLRAVRPPPASLSPLRCDLTSDVGVPAGSTAVGRERTHRDSLKKGEQGGASRSFPARLGAHGGPTTHRLLGTRVRIEMQPPASCCRELLPSTFPLRTFLMDVRESRVLPASGSAPSPLHRLVETCC